MTSISGTIRIGEAQQTCAATARRQRGGTGWFWILILALVLGLGAAGMGLASLVAVSPAIGWLAGALTGMAIYHRWSKVLMVRRIRGRPTATGMLLDLPVQFEMSPVTLVYEIGEVRMIAQWPAVSELFYAKGYWIFMVQSDPWFAPDHFFASDDAKRAFLGEALSHMSEAAKARSADAVAFATA